MTRKSAIAHLAHKITACKTFGESWADNVNVVALEMAIEALQERPTGHWRDDGEMMWCSNCGHGEDAYFGCYDEPIHGNGMIGWARRYPAYCKRCGAKMNDGM